MVECQLPKLNVAGSNPVIRFVTSLGFRPTWSQSHGLLGPIFVATQGIMLIVEVIGLTLASRRFSRGA